MLTCIIIAGNLWISDGSEMVMPKLIRKPERSDVVTLYRADNSSVTRFRISEQHQLRMGTEEFVTDCVLSGYTVDVSGWDDIDVNERTGIDD